MQDQDEFITHDTNFEDVAVVANDRANLEDVGCNADLYIYVYRQSRRLYPRGYLAALDVYASASVHECA